MKRREYLSWCWSRSAVRGSCRVGLLLGGVAVLGCLPVSDFGDGGGTTGSGGSAGSGEGMSVTSNVGVTGTGGITGEGSTGTSSSSSGEAMPTTADPTCGGFICGTDMGKWGDCAVFLQDCPEGDKCAPVITDGGTWDSARCVPVTGTDVAGDPCVAKSVADGLDSCVKGAICWGVDMDGNGSCVAQCGGTPDAPTCPDEGLCTIASRGFLALCIPDCDPLLQDCTGGDACYPIDDGFTCAPDASGDTGKANEPCEFINVCEAGLLCGDPAFVGAGCPMGSMGCCTPFCGFPDGACPNPDQECVQWFDPAMLPEGDPLLDIGACGVPS